MRRLLSVRSNRSARNTSLSFRDSVRASPRKRLRASCWVMVLPPRTIRPASRSRRAEAWISFQSSPPWVKNASSSATSTARRSSGETRSYGIHRWSTGAVAPRSRISAVRRGTRVARSETG